MLNSSTWTQIKFENRLKKKKISAAQLGIRRRVEGREVAASNQKGKCVAVKGNKINKFIE